MKGQRIIDDTFLMLLNAHHEPPVFHPADTSYERALETTDRHCHAAAWNQLV